MTDSFLKKYSDKYDTWFEQDLIDYSSKVIPIQEALVAEQQILPNCQALEVLTKAEKIALAKCTCRDRYKHCDKPLEVCFILNETADAWIEKNKARPINLDEAREILKLVNQSGLVHMTLFKPNRKIFAFCSCCPCCCHDLQLLLKWGKSQLTARSDYIAQDDSERCVSCGECIDRCPFEARAFNDQEIIYSPEHCYGCGLCVTTCPEEAIQLTRSQ